MVKNLLAKHRYTSLLSGVLVLAFALLRPVSAQFPDDQVYPFRIGTGGNAGTYFPIGSLIARGISGRAAVQNCEKCPRSEILALAQRSNGSAANVNDIGAGLLESGLSQADVVHWAYNGAGAFSGVEPISNLRTIATLYFESLHLVVHVDSGITEMSDLVGKRVSVDEVGSGTQLNVEYVLQSQGIEGEDLQTVYLKATDAIDRLRRQQLDAFFIVAGYPVAGVSELIENGIGRIVPIDSPDISALLREYPFFTIDEIPVNTYGNDEKVETLAVPAQLIVSADMDEDLVYQITALLWSEVTLNLLSQGHPKGREVKFSTALVGLSAPLHPGAERLYRERAHHYFRTLPE